MIELQADYIIIGSGAIGMAFADILVTESDASLIIIDRFAKPGGHWNVAYPFVQLHQPAAFYGVSSKELSSGRLEPGGLNKGLGEMSSGPEILAYYDEVMQRQFLPTGRVQYFPMCDYQGHGETISGETISGEFTSKVTGQSYRAKANQKIIDCTYLKTTVPSTHTPSFKVHENAQFIPLNDLPKLKTPPEAFVIIGAGKTGIDACLWLLEHHVEPEKITWIINRDAWMLDRQNTQITEAFFFDTIGAFAAQMESIAQADNPDDMFDRLEQAGYFLRIDKDVRPGMFKGATVSKGEIKALQRIKNVVRMGHVTAIDDGQIILTEGKLPTRPDTVYVDCSASAIMNQELKPIFNGNVVTPQMIRPYQPVFSAAMIAHIELNYGSDADKNRLCLPLALPSGVDEFIDFTLGSLLNQREWAKHPELKSWITNNRLDGVGKMLKNLDKMDDDKAQILAKIKQNAPLAAMKLMMFKQAR